MTRHKADFQIGRIWEGGSQRIKGWASYFWGAQWQAREIFGMLMNLTTEDLYYHVILVLGYYKPK